MNRVCELFGLSKWSYYNARDRRERLEKKYGHFKRYVTKIVKHNSAYGIKRIKAELKEAYGLHIGRDTLGELLNLWGLGLLRTIKKRRRSVIEKILQKLKGKANLLARIRLCEPFQAVSSDISVIWYAQGARKAYLCVHKDVFGQMVYGYAIKQRMDTELVLSSFNRAKARIARMLGDMPKKLIFHQDQGSQYTSHEYVEAVTKHARLSYSAPGTPTENAGQESFFGRFKDEWRDSIMELETFSDVEIFINKKIRYYNKRRRHSSIHYRSPFSFTKLLLKIS